MLSRLPASPVICLRYAPVTGLYVGAQRNGSARGISLRASGRSGSVGLAGNPLLTDPASVTAYAQSARRETQPYVDAVLAAPRDISVVRALDELSDRLCEIHCHTSMIANLHPIDEFVSAASEGQMHLVGVVQEMNTHKGMFNALDAVIKNPAAVATFTEEEKAVAHLYHKEFIWNGVHLPQKDQIESARLAARIDELGSLYYFNVGRAQREGSRASLGVNWKVLVELVETRHKLAKLLGYRSFAHMANQDKILGSPERVNEFLRGLLSTLVPRLARIKDERMAVLVQQGVNKDIAAEIWPTHYNRSSSKTSVARVDAQRALSTILATTFGVELRPQSLRPGESWVGAELERYKAHRIDNGAALGDVYVDAFTRHGKGSGAHHVLVNRRRIMAGPRRGEIQLPKVCLSFDQPKSTHMDPNDVCTYFHEHGHLLHCILSTIEYQQLWGIRATTDLAETPSTLMEYFAQDPRILSMYATPEQTEQVLARWRDGSTYEQYCQLFLGLLDMGIAMSASVEELEANIDAAHALCPEVPRRNQHLDTTHVVSYAGNYYSYQLARVLSSYMYKKCFGPDPLSPAAGQRYIDGFLRHGGTRNALDMVRAATGMSPDLDTLIRESLNERV